MINKWNQWKIIETPKFFHDGGRYHIETSPLICGANQWTGFYMIAASVIKELIMGDFNVDNNPLVSGVH